MNLDFSLAEVHAQRVLDLCGLESPTEMSLEDIIFGRGAFYEEKPLDGKEGQIVSLDGKSFITINCDIESAGRKRFTAAHELGHHEMHQNISPIFSDTEENLLNWYQTSEHEAQANQFAAEFLMPSNLFYSEAKKACGSDTRKLREEGIDIPSIIDHLVSTFEVSRTAAMLKFATRGIHPVMVVYCKRNTILRFEKSIDFPYYLIGTRIQTRPESIASEAFTNDTTYIGLDRKQRIPKSAWFFTNKKDLDDQFFEYCVYAKNYGYTMSIIWEK